LFQLLVINFILTISNPINNIYIDESCHLEHDQMTIMCIGYSKIKTDQYIANKEEIRRLKLRYRIPAEIKWNSISASQLPLYMELIDFYGSFKTPTNGLVSDHSILY